MQNQKFYIFSALVLLNFQLLWSQEEVKAPEGYQLAWADEFNATGKPDAEFWSYEAGFVRNEELQWYQKDNASLKNGLLHIESRLEEVKNDRFVTKSKNWKKNREFANYTSSSINTKGKYNFKYGILEVRAKIDTARGMWPAIWTLGIDKPWPSNGEIDIMEFYLVNNKSSILANAAWKSESEYVTWNSKKIPFSEFLSNDPDWPNKFHIWKMDWTEESIKIYLDDKLLTEIDLTKTQNPDGFNPFHQPHYILLNLAIGGNGGDPAQTEFPKEYQVDYVRVFQKK